jgi:hypothetical protein
MASVQVRIMQQVRRNPLAAVAIVGLASAGAGFALDVRGFAVGLLASIAALAMTVLTATFFFDELAEKQAAARRRDKWNIVRVATLTAIWEQVRRMTLPIAMRSPTADTFAVAYKTALELMDGVSSWIPTEATPLDEDAADGLATYEEYKASMTRLYEDVAREYVYIRDVLTPRVLDLADDVELTRLLFDLDDAERQWSAIVFTAGKGETQGSWATFPVDTWKAVADFHQAAVEVARHVASAPDLPQPRTIQLVSVAVGGRWSFRSRTLRE